MNRLSCMPFKPSIKYRIGVMPYIMNISTIQEKTMPTYSYLHSQFAI